MLDKEIESFLYMLYKLIGDSRDGSSALTKLSQIYFAKLIVYRSDTGSGSEYDCFDP